LILIVSTTKNCENNQSIYRKYSSRDSIPLMNMQFCFSEHFSIKENFFITLFNTAPYAVVSLRLLFRGCGDRTQDSCFLALAIRRSNHPAYNIHTRLNLIHSDKSHPHSAKSHPQLGNISSTTLYSPSILIIYFVT
jgi:hypothetical protein